MALLLGMRASEVLCRVVRDLDDAGRVLWIPLGKTDNARRRLAGTTRPKEKGSSVRVPNLFG